jgi:polysaccharide export outer membrane protein
MNRFSPKLPAAACICALLIVGCGGGNRYISNRGGEVETAELDLSDIPVRTEPNEYIIGQGDELDILFLYNQEFTQLGLKVRPDGKISLTFVGDIAAAGKGVSELDSLLTARYSEIIRNPNITVVVKNYRPQIVYAMGEVSKPGGYEFRPGMTLLDFLALGGGQNKFAKRNEILVIRRVAPDRVVGIQIDFKELVDKHRFDLDIPLQAFDIVYVPKSRIQSAQDFALAMRDIVLAPADIYLRGWQVANQKVLFDFYKRTGSAY